MTRSKRLAGASAYEPMNDDAKSAIGDLLIALAICATFFLVAGILMWFAGQSVFFWQLAGGFVLFTLGVLAISLIGMLIQAAARINMYDRTNIYVGLNIVLSALPVLVWTAYAAHLASGAVNGFGMLSAAATHLVGFLSCYAAHTMVHSQFRGTIYALITLPIGLLGYVVFAVFPWLARILLAPLLGM
jgi:hypothetical protein